MDYRYKLIHLNLLPLMYFLYLADIMLFVNLLKKETKNLNILDFVKIRDSITQPLDKVTLTHVAITNIIFSSMDLQGYGTNYVPLTYQNHLR